MIIQTYLEIKVRSFKRNRTQICYFYMFVSGALQGQYVGLTMILRLIKIYI